MRYYSVQEAKWITIGAQAKKPGTKGANGKKHGGVSVLISDDGTILKGPAHMKGKKPDELGGRQKTLGEKPGEKQEPKKYQNLAFGPNGEIAEPDKPKSPPPGAGYGDLRAAAKVEPAPPALPAAKPVKTKAAKAQKPPDDYDTKQDKKHAKNLARLEKSRKDLANIGDAGRTLLAKAPPEMHAKIQGLIDRADAEKDNLATALRPKEFPDMGEPPPIVTDYTPGADYSDSYDDLRKAAAQPAPEPAQAPAPAPAKPTKAPKVAKVAKPEPAPAPTPEPKPEKGETVRAKIARVKAEKEKRYNDTLKKRGKKEADKQRADDKRQAKAEKDALNPAQAEARKKKQVERISKINAARPESLISLVRKEGGISGGDYDYATDIKEFGLKSAMNKRGLKLDDMAKALQNAGHLVVPEGKKAEDVLLAGLQARANSALHNHTGRYDSEYDDFINSREDADNAPGADSDQVAAVISRGEEAGENQGDDDGLAQILGLEPNRSDADEPEPSDYGHPDDYEPEEGDLGDGGEVTGADTSFDFGAPEPEPVKAPAPSPEPAPAPALATAPEPGTGFADLRAAAAQIKEPQRGWTAERQDFHHTGIGGVNTHAGKTSDGAAEFDELKSKLGANSGEIDSVNLGELYRKHLDAAMAQGGVGKNAFDSAMAEGPTGKNYSRLTALNGEAARRTRAELKEKTGPYIVHNTDGAIAAGYHANPSDMVPGATDTDYRKSSAAIITGPETQAKNYKAIYAKPAKASPALAEPLFGNQPTPEPTPATTPAPGTGYGDLRAAAKVEPEAAPPAPPAPPADSASSTPEAPTSLKVTKAIGYHRQGKTAAPAYLAKISGTHNGKTFNREFQDGDEDTEAKQAAYRRKKGTYSETHAINDGELYEHSQDGDRKLFAVLPSADGKKRREKVSYEMPEVSEASRIMGKTNGGAGAGTGRGEDIDIPELLAHQHKMALKTGSYKGLTLPDVARDLVASRGGQGEPEPAPAPAPTPEPGAGYAELRAAATAEPEKPPEPTPTAPPKMSPGEKKRQQAEEFEAEKRVIGVLKNGSATHAELRRYTAPLKDFDPENPLENPAHAAVDRLLKTGRLVSSGGETPTLSLRSATPTPAAPAPPQKPIDLPPKTPDTTSPGATTAPEPEKSKVEHFSVTASGRGFSQAIALLKKRGGKFNPATKTWAVPTGKVTADDASSFGLQQKVRSKQDEDNFGDEDDPERHSKYFGAATPSKEDYMEYFGTKTPGETDTPAVSPMSRSHFTLAAQGGPKFHQAVSKLLSLGAARQEISGTWSAPTGIISDKVAVELGLKPNKEKNMNQLRDDFRLQGHNFGEAADMAAEAFKGKSLDGR